MCVNTNFIPLYITLPYIALPPSSIFVPSSFLPSCFLALFPALESRSSSMHLQFVSFISLSLSLIFRRSKTRRVLFRTTIIRRFQVGNVISGRFFRVHFYLSFSESASTMHRPRPASFQRGQREILMGLCETTSPSSCPPLSFFFSFLFSRLTSLTLSVFHKVSLAIDGDRGVKAKSRRDRA